MCEEVIKISEQIHGVTEDAFTQLINEKEKVTSNFVTQKFKFFFSYY